MKITHGFGQFPMHDNADDLWDTSPAQSGDTMARTVEIDDLDDPGFRRYFTRFTDSAWRLETLQTYSVADEDAAFNRFLDGHFDPGHVMPWIRNVITPAVKNGRDIGRVHIVERTTDEDGTLAWNDYLRFEFTVYQHTKAAGEDIRLAVVEPGTWPKDVWAKGRDFWLFDEHTDHPVIMEMQYNRSGAFRKAIITKWPTRPVLDRAIRCKRAALCASRPFYP